MSQRIVIALAVLAAIVVAGCSAPSATTNTNTNTNVVDTVAPQSVSGGGTTATGGSVKDVKGSVTGFAADKTTGDNSGSTTVVFSGVANDGNGEQDIAFIAVASTGLSNLGANHTVTAAERNATTEPSTYGTDGFKVWNPTARDGALSFKFQKTISAFTTAGTYVFSATEGNPSGVTSLPSGTVSFVLTSFSSITVWGSPVDATGANSTGNWGQWSANPSDKNVTAANYIKLVNTGDIANSQVVIDFTEATFSGASDSSWTVPIDGNVQFAWCDVASTAVAPSACTWTWGATSSGGSVTTTFAGKGHVVYVQYRLVELPATLAAQSYGATFTVTEL